MSPISLESIDRPAADYRRNIQEMNAFFDKHGNSKIEDFIKDLKAKKNQPAKDYKVGRVMRDASEARRREEFDRACDSKAKKRMMGGSEA
ncbi:hypothetical protein SMACR_09757 [Sordaria macrospora]|uniref:WGS project CABT00000000 data, contig 2.181 n=2 Tax=Sordaria macrospora TaxID=5147 RepID=F7WCP7_SORMK|nr:uncharacterized protein SMAC_09757 [Sordaria macrospora k-hell]KAA8623894.1 hypothetical protein SMACR_09757 [Sordaria macrospora]KAH7635308.1 hypothetical protein B0T09DRAFT_328488 [Sordaria sp. MPI-SDFR-AT-0083]WPJ67253.1 hypothetical protein SMAC4_09757 [Sordaria macrospora]CCC05672.1 unnamed protein product [Sordaria macrospora k-hell]